VTHPAPDVSSHRLPLPRALTELAPDVTDPAPLPHSSTTFPKFSENSPQSLFGGRGLNRGNGEGRDRKTGRFVGEDELERFAGFVGATRDRVTLPSGCVLWLGPLNDQGYAVFRVKRNGRWTKVPAYRYAWELKHGPVPEGYTLDHRCHTLDPRCPGGPTCLHRRCVNVDPMHLEPVPRGVNGRRRHRRDAVLRALALDPVGVSANQLLYEVLELPLGLDDPADA
jgi:hypothetical protein